MFWFPVQRLSETFLIPRRTELDIIINVHRLSYKVPSYKVPSYKVPLCLSDFNKIRFFFRQIFLKVLKYQISWKSVKWEPSCSMRRTDGWTDKQDEANSRLSQFCERAWQCVPGWLLVVSMCCTTVRIPLWPASPTTVTILAPAGVR